MSSHAAIVAVVVALVIQRALELRLARRNQRRAQARGAREFGARHYPAFFLLHGAWLLAWPLEGWSRGTFAWPWLVPLLSAQLLRYWAIASLGERWNTRVLMVPGDAPLRRGPYRMLSHPNYVAVVIELAAVPLVFGAHVTAVVASIANLVLLLGVRIPCEVAALRWASDADQSR